MTKALQIRGFRIFEVGASEPKRSRKGPEPRDLNGPGPEPPSGCRPRTLEELSAVHIRRHAPDALAPLHRARGISRPPVASSNDDRAALANTALQVLVVAARWRYPPDALDVITDGLRIDDRSESRRARHGGPGRRPALDSPVTGTRATLRYANAPPPSARRCSASGAETPPRPEREPGPRVTRAGCRFRSRVPVVKNSSGS
jgi:hypothetical protein